ncbi:serine/threonine-protein kinase [Embleya scabrispora]|uniref:serine/threonine-protein kinase n=1 Tax=Embleya scabrispora TaxID=159449 RepID=UPI00035D2880|nr:serine/threonine-protein kinase [Embleya scabrispora]MYS82392.1 protein kinase [Streptomyces sp. SID5474]
MAQLWLGSRYRLDKRLGSGGNATVWRAWDQKMQRFVAVKVLKESFGASNNSVDRFGREAIIVGGLSSPNIIVVHDQGRKEVVEHRTGPGTTEPEQSEPERLGPGRLDPATRVFTHEAETVHDAQITSALGPGPGDLRRTDGKVMYLAMELITGRSLAQLVADGAWLPLGHVVGWAIQLCDGLDVAHSGGVLHRDIKPANVMVTSRGVVKVLDFGIARYMEKVSSRAGITMPGSMIGTPAYMSPEQILGGRIDGRADLYSVGCVLHELLTGAPPFGLDRPHSMMTAHLQRPPESVRNTRLEVPEDLAALVLALLAKRPENRPASAAEVRDRLLELSVVPPRNLAPQPWGMLASDPVAPVDAQPTQDQPVRLVLDTAEPRPARASDSLQVLRAELGQRMREFGVDHPDTLLLREQLAARLGKDGDPLAAITLLRGVISDGGRLRGALSPDTLRARRALAHWTGEAGRPADAAQLLKNLLPDQVHVLGTDHLETLRVRRERARWDGQAGNFVGAVLHLRALVPDVIRVLGPNHELVIEVWDDLTYWEHRLDGYGVRDEA